jgi:hypothetical protein
MVRGEVACLDTVDLHNWMSSRAWYDLNRLPFNNREAEEKEKNIHGSLGHLPVIKNLFLCLGTYLGSY